jgi:hypothetical protein
LIIDLCIHQIKQQEIESLIIQYGIDLAVLGHMHCYERITPVKYNNFTDKDHFSPDENNFNLIKSIKKKYIEREIHNECHQTLKARTRTLVFLIRDTFSTISSTMTNMRLSSSIIMLFN